jgi:Tol biopolymer transport system component
MAYISDRSGNAEVWVKDLKAGHDLPVTRTDKAEIFTAISCDGNRLAFWDGTAVYEVNASGGAPRLLCEQCGRPDDWSPDGKLILWHHQKRAPSSIAALDPSTGTLTHLTSHQTLQTIAPDLSPDGNWLTFHTLNQFNRQVFIASNARRWMPSSTWIAVTDGKALDREAKWSPDGRRIYFLSDRDGFRCIWARNVDSGSKQPSGSIYPVVHLHDARLSLLYVPNTGNVSVCPVGDKLIFAVGELSGNLWMTDLGK